MYKRNKATAPGLDPGRNSQASPQMVKTAIMPTVVAVDIHISVVGSGYVGTTIAACFPI